MVTRQVALGSRQPVFVLPCPRLRHQESKRGGAASASASAMEIGRVDRREAQNGAEGERAPGQPDGDRSRLEEGNDDGWKRAAGRAAGRWIGGDCVSSGGMNRGGYMGDEG